MPASRCVDFQYNLEDVNDIYNYLNYIDLYDYFQKNRPVIFIEGLLYTNKTKTKDEIKIIHNNILKSRNSCEKKNNPIIVSLTDDIINNDRLDFKGHPNKNIVDKFDVVLDIKDINHNINDNKKEIELLMSKNSFWSINRKLKLDYYSEVYHYNFK